MFTCLFVRTDRSIFTRGSVRRESTVVRAVFPVYPRTQPLQQQPTFSQVHLIAALVALSRR